MSRYDKYFLQHILYLEDDFCQYYVQDDFWGRQEILDVEDVVFDWEEDAEEWMARCINWDRYDTISRLRRFLAADCLTQYPVHRMNDRQVMRIAARELCSYAMRTVIKPRIGWAVQVDPVTRQPVPAIAVAPADDIDGMLAELKTYLDAMVAEAQKKKEQHLSALAGRNSAEVALYYSGNAGDAVYQNQVADTWDDLVSAVKKFPGFYKGFLKAHLKLFQFPGQMAQLTTQALYTGDINPLKEEIDKIVDPVVHGYEQAMHYKSILTILLGDQQTYALLWDFAQRYYDASHPVELARLGATAAAEIVVTIVLALVSYGIGAAANIAAKSTRLIKVAKLLEKIALAIRKTKQARALVENAEEAAAKTPKTVKKTKRAGKHMLDVDKPKAVERLDDKTKKGYEKGKKSNGPKATTKTPDELYKAIRNSKKDVADIAKHNNLKPERIQKIKDYVFDNPNHTPHKPTAEAWERLSKGKGTEHDKLLLKHETAEMFYNDWIKHNPEKYMERYDPLTSHDITNYKGYDWESGLPTE